MGETAAQVQVRPGSRRESHDAAVSDVSVAVVGADHPDAPIGDAPRPRPRVEDLERESRPPTPRFIQDAGSWKRLKWVPYPVRRLVKAAAAWVRGPPTPRRYRIDPLLPRIQHAPMALLERHLPRRRSRVLAFFGFWGLWLVAFALVMRHGLAAAEIADWGPPAPIGCGATYWVSGNGCGVDGVDCRPFTDGGFAFRCPADCASYKVLNPRAVGDQEVIYRPLVIGGPPAAGNGTAVYRGDSYICGAAIHAGVVSNAHGGCGVVRLVGRGARYDSTTRNGITSVAFDSSFPLSFAFEPGVQCDARDMMWPLLAVSVAFSAVFSALVTSPALFFFPLFAVLFWTVGMATDAPNHSDVATLFSIEVGRFLPAAFVAWVMYDRMGVRRALEGLTAQMEKTVLWLGAAWVGALTNHTLDFIPIQRLTAHDLGQQPGARAALAVIVVLLAAAVAVQAWFLRQEGRLVRYLGLYGLLGLGLVVCAVLPDLNLRIHHYVLALLLLPGTAIQIRPSLLYQGLLVGLFVNGIARWGFDPVLQTDHALRGDAPARSPLPSIRPPVVAGNSSITFSWDPPPPAYDGISVLVNDVERFRTYFDDASASNNNNITWARRAEDAGMNEYFRFAWMQGSQRGDYTRAGTWGADGTWSPMEPGPSKLRARDEGGRGEMRRQKRRA
ncbi:hypothetical protein VTH06DRAFT_1286 [Thermothelomyces fergusii]